LKGIQALSAIDLIVATWSLSHCQITIGVPFAVSWFTAFSNPLAHTWSSRTVFPHAVTGTIFHVAFTHVVVVGFTQGVIHSAWLTQFESVHSCHTGVGVDFALISVRVRTPFSFLYTLSPIVW
jgi:hypothetical protein